MIKLLKHKWFVLLYCFRFGLYKQGLFHDNDKWFPFFSYRNKYVNIRKYVKQNLKKEELRVNYFRNLHKIHSTHHWEYYLKFNGKKYCPEIIPVDYVFEMIFDWLAHNNNSISDAKIWYNDNVNRMILNDKTKLFIEKVFGALKGLEEI